MQDEVKLRSKIMPNSIDSIGQQNKRTGVDGLDRH